MRWFGLFIFVLASFFVSQSALRAEPLDDSLASIAETLSGQLQVQQKNRLAVYGFSELNGYKSGLSDYVSEELITALFQYGSFTVVERRELQRVLAEHQQYASGDFDPAQIAEFGKLLGVDVIITGSITRLSDRFVRINARAVSVETGRIFAAAAETVDRSPIVESLLGQGGLRSDTSGAQSVGAMVGQPSDLTFNNGIIQITVRGARISNDSRRSVLVTADVSNLTGQELFIGGEPNRSWSATTDHGENLIFHSGTIRGLPALSNGRFQTSVNANETISVVFVARPGGAGNIQGGELNLAGTIATLAGRSPRKFQFRLNRIQLAD